jgi:hypothetical protein
MHLPTAHLASPLDSIRSMYPGRALPTRNWKDSTVQGQLSQQFRNRRNFVGWVIRLALAQHQMC